jgi:WD40 repeat protein
VLSPDARILALIPEGSGRPIRLCDLVAGPETRVLDGSARAAAFAPDGRTLATGTKDGGLRLWDAVSGKALRELGQPSKYSQRRFSLGFTPDGRALAAGADGIDLWEVSTGKQLSRCASAAGLFAFSPDGTTLAGPGRLPLVEDAVIHFWEAKTGTERPTPAGHRFDVTALAVSPDGTLLASGSMLSSTVYLWQPANGKPLHSFHQDWWVHCLAFTNDGQYLGSGGTGFWLRDVGTGALRRSLPERDRSAYQLFPAAGRLQLGLVDEKSFVFQDAVTGTELRRLDPPSAWQRHVMLPDGKVLLFGSRKEHWFWRNQATGREVQLPDKVTCAPVFSADGRLLAFGAGSEGEPLRGGAKEGKVYLLDIATGETLLSAKAYPDPVGGGLALAPDGRSLALGDNDGSVRVLETITGNKRLRFVGHRGAVKTVAFTPDGTRLASGSVDTTVLLWDLIGTTSAERSRVLSDDEVRRRWAKLAGTDAAAAYEAILDLSAAPQSALTLLNRQLRPVAAPDAQQLARWLADLDAPSFAAREHASAELAKLGDRAVPALRTALAAQPSTEAHRRLKALLERMIGPVRSPEELQALRGIEVLEHVGNRPARDLLHTIANGFAESRQTQSAKGALERLAKRPVGHSK